MNYAKLIESLLSKSKKIDFILLTGSRNDRKKIDKIMAWITPSRKKYCLNLAGKTDLLELAYLQKKSQLVLAPDTGPLHLASHQKVASLGLYTAVPTELTGPYLHLSSCVNAYMRAKTLMPPKASYLLEKKKVHRLGHPKQMQLISIAEVIKKIQGMLPHLF